MPLLSWFSAQKTRRLQPRRATGRKPGARFRPQLETLEARDVPSTLTVTNNLDSGGGSLRADIAAANPGDAIIFAPSLDGQTITLTSGQLFINKSLSIQGPGAGQLAISGYASGGFTGSRVFEVYSSNANVLLSGLTITRGNGRGSGPSGDGGGILNMDGSTLTISGCTLSNNHADNGGAIYNFGATLNVVNSTLSGNLASDVNGGGEGGALCSVGLGNMLSMTGCTVSNNTAAGYDGGGIYLYSTPTTISGCKLSGNVTLEATATGDHPVGNDIYNGGTAKMLKIQDSVFSNDTPYSFAPIYGPWTDGRGNTFNY